MKIFTTVVCLLVSAAVWAQGKDSWVDPETGHRVVRLARLPGENSAFYFHDNPFIGNKMIFYNTRDGLRRLCSVDLATLESRELTAPRTDIHGEIVAKRGRLAYYQSRDSVFATNIDTRETKLVFVFPAGFQGNVTTLNSDETLLAGMKASDEEKELLRKYPEKHDFFNRIYDAHLPHTLFTIDVRNGVLTRIYEESEWLGHVQFSPVDPGLLMFCHEGPWQKVDRIWTIDLRTKAVKSRHRRTMENEIAGHEFFAPDGRSIWFDWQLPKGQTFFLGNVDLATGIEKKYAITRDEWSIHFNVRSDQQVFAGDGGDSGQVAKAKNGRWIYLFHIEGDHLVSEKLVNMKDQRYKLEPNVRFSPDGKWVIFRGNFEGHEDIYAVEVEKKNERTAILAWPSVDSITRPWTRWWWMGSAVDRQGLTWNMEKYRAVGLGGLELTPIYGVKGYERQFVKYLSPEWVDLFDFTRREARRLGLGLDISTGTGWPFGGGPLIDTADACKEFWFRHWSVGSGMRLNDSVQYVQERLERKDGPAMDQFRAGGRLPLQVLMAYGHHGEVEDLSSRVNEAGRLDWTAAAGGSWDLYGVFAGLHGKMVERAAPGAEGNVIDHFSAKALDKYLSRFDTALNGRSLDGLRSWFNDSYEVDDARGQSNWTPGFFDVFQRLRGYDLRQHLNELLGGDTVSRVLCDYRETISDLLLGEFTLPWRNWAHRKGGLIRDQAHGSPANILDLYSESDIPETEGDDIFRYKMATSAAHVMGKPLASAESVTWLNEHFLSSPGDVRHAVDGYFLGGVNHIFYHGTAYTPESDPWPGWLFYASVHFTPNDPNWPYFNVLNNYVARCQSFLQKGSTDNDVLLYYPLYDSWARRGTDLLKHYDRLEPEWTGSGLAACAVSMQKEGYAWDYISDRQVRELSNSDRGMTTSGGAVYQTIVLPDCRYISVEAMEQLVKLAEGGATIIVYGGMPGDVPGWGQWKERQKVLRQLEAKVVFKPMLLAGVKEGIVGRGRFLSGNDLGRMLQYAQVRQETMVFSGLSFIRRRYENGYTYFIANRGAQPWRGKVVLESMMRSVAIFDPMRGTAGLGRVVDVGKRLGVYLQLASGESCIVKTSPVQEKAEPFVYYDKAGTPDTVRGQWKLEVDGGWQTTMDSLGSWTRYDTLRAFSGTGTYRISFKRPGGVSFLLDLGKVHQTAVVMLNGKVYDTLLRAPYTVVLPALELRDENLLEVRVTNLMVNRIIDMDRRGIKWKKFYNTNFPAHDRANRGSDGLFDASHWEPAASGLLGPVTITALKRIP